MGEGGVEGLVVWVIVSWLPSKRRCQGSETQLWPGAVNSSPVLFLEQMYYFLVLFCTSIAHAFSHGLFSLTLILLVSVSLM